MHGPAVKKALSFLLIFQVAISCLCQSKPVIYTNSTNAYFNNNGMQEKWSALNRINDIILNPDSTFECWSRPHLSCFTWQHIGGKWTRVNDTLFMRDQYEVEEQGINATYKRDTGRRYLIAFSTDHQSVLVNKDVKIYYQYDYDAHLDEQEHVFDLPEDNTLIIPFSDIPYWSDLSAIKVEYLLGNTEIRVAYLTTNEFVNKKKEEVPNTINVVFVEKPRMDIVYRITKGLVHGNTLLILSTIKTKTKLPDHHRDLAYESSYSLNK